MLDESEIAAPPVTAPAAPSTIEAWLRDPARRRVPVIRQAEAAECGLACLAMVANHLGHETDLLTLRRARQVSLRGMSLAQLIDAARQLGLQARALRVELGSLRELRRPAILHWNFEHFVVLVEADARRIVIHDPASGRRELGYAEASRAFTGLALELERGASFEPSAPRPRLSLRHLTGRLVGLRRSLLQLFVLSLALQVLLLVAPLFVQLVMDHVLVSAQTDLLTVLGLGFGALLLTQVSMGVVRGWSVATLSEQLGVQWKSQVLAHLLRLPIDFFEKRNLGDVSSRIGSINSIRTTLSAQFVEALIDGAMSTVVFAILLAYDARLALLPLTAVLLYAALRALAYGPVRATAEEQLVRDAGQQSHLLESLRGMHTIKSIGMEHLRLSVWQNLLLAAANADLRQARLQTVFQALSQGVFGLERIAVVWIGATLVLDARLSAGMLVAFIAYKDLFALRLGALIDKWIEFRMLRVHGERLADLVLTAPEEAEAAPTTAPLPGPRAARSALETEDLGYRYAEGERWILRHCDLQVAEGESVAIVGPSGCGKSTLLKLLLSLLSPTEGRVLLDARDIRAMGLQRYRALLGAVLQDDHLFAGNLYDNIAGFDPDARPEDVERVARQAQVHEEIAAMPMGYRSLIGDMGSAFSGGQKQRLLLARALYRRPRILLLDEATSHLDLDNERAVNAAIRELDITRIVIAHRRETIAAADRVLVFEKGRLVSS